MIRNVLECNRCHMQVDIRTEPHFMPELPEGWLYVGTARTHPSEHYCSEGCLQAEYNERAEKALEEELKRIDDEDNTIAGVPKAGC